MRRPCGRRSVLVSDTTRRNDLDLDPKVSLINYDTIKNITQSNIKSGTIYTRYASTLINNCLMRMQQFSRGLDSFSAVECSYLKSIYN